MRKKFLILSLISLIILITVYFLRFSIYDNLPKNYQSILRVIFSNKINTIRLNNDYNVKFLPQTQFTYINFESLSLNTTNTNISGYGNFVKRKPTKTFYLDIYKNDIFITLINGDIYKSNIPDLQKKIISLKKINSNTKNIKVLDTLIHKDQFLISAEENTSENCKKLVVFKGNISDKIVFKKKIIDENCYKTIQSGRLQFDNQMNGFIIGTAADILKFKDQKDDKPQDPNSLMGKILFFNFNLDKPIIISKGHRNILGLLSIDDKIISTENGPKGGDEINLIKLGENYGWPLASYGEKYNSIDTNELFYLKSHSKFGFEEPIYSFVPSIGISEIIKLDNNFSSFWEDNYLVGSLNSRHIYRVKFDKKIKKVLYIESIYIGDRIRDLKYSKKFNIILLALEETGSIGILSSN